ncbi:hypothetical protein D3C72_1572010 [compost metagenome]
MGIRQFEQRGLVRRQRAEGHFVDGAVHGDAALAAQQRIEQVAPLRHGQLLQRLAARQRQPDRFQQTGLVLQPAAARDRQAACAGWQLEALGHGLVQPHGTARQDLGAGHGRHRIGAAEAEEAHQAATGQPLANEGALALHALQQAVLYQHGDRLPDRSQRNAELLGQHAFGRDRLARRPVAGDDPGLQFGRDLAVSAHSRDGRCRLGKVVVSHVRAVLN